MRIHVGCELAFDFPQETPLIAILNVHHSRVPDLYGIETFKTAPAVKPSGYHDQFGNWCNRLVAPAGSFSLGTNAIVNDSGDPDPVVLDAVQHPVQDLPDGKVDARTNNGYRLYHGSCNHCHGPDGMGSIFAASLIDNYPMSKPSGALFATARSATFQP